MPKDTNQVQTTRKIIISQGHVRLRKLPQLSEVKVYAQINLILLNSFFV